MKTRIPTIVAVLVTLFIAIALRLPRLDVRPMHADEAVQAAITRDLWLEGRYAYNPDEFHGPTLPYATLPALWLSGADDYSQTTETTFRVTPVLFGVACILLLFLLHDALGRGGVAVAAILLAVSPAFVFYSRYTIHETLLVFFTLAAIGCGWRAWRDGRIAWAIATGACIGLMQATKETAVLTYAAAFGALVMTWAYEKATTKRSEAAPPRIRWTHLGAAALAAVVVGLVLYTSFFTNVNGPIDAARTYMPWLARAGGESPHIQPWHFYLHRLAYWQVGDGPVWSEGLILALAIIGGASAFACRSTPSTDGTFLRWLTLQTLLLTLAYTIIPYKTPWCALQFLLGCSLLAGRGAAVLIAGAPSTPGKTVVAILIGAGVAHLGWQAYQASHVLPADPRNPYVYAQASSEGQNVVKLGADVEAVVEAMRRLGEEAPIRVFWTDSYYWPLPWHLRRCGRVGYWTSLPDDDLSTVPVIISSAEHEPVLAPRIQPDNPDDVTHLLIGFYALRPGVLAALYVRYDLWAAHLERNER